MAFEQDTGSILAVDVGTVTTRAVLFDKVDGEYRFIARGESPTTAGSPWEDVSEGLRAAISDITVATARELLDEVELIMPEGQYRNGIDNFIASTSAGRPQRAILVGLTPDVSLESARRAAGDTYIHIQDIISMTDGRSREQQVDAILGINPDLLFLVGGTTGGATQAMLHQIRTVALSYMLMGVGSKPQILFAGNPATQDEVRKQIEEALGIDVRYADNIRPSLAVEQLDSAKTELAALFQRFKFSTSGGLSVLADWSSSAIVPTARAFGRIIHFMGQRGDGDVLGIDIGSTATIVAATRNKRPYLKVFGEMGIGHNVKGVLDFIEHDDLSRWLSIENEDNNQAINYAWNKLAYPASVPQTASELEMELALAREIMRVAYAQACQQWHGLPAQSVAGHFTSIVIGGSALGDAPHPGHSALAALDALQPTGIVQLLLDTDSVAATLGSAAELEARVAIDVLDSGGLLNLGTAICPTGRAKQGRMVLRTELIRDGETKGEKTDVRYGSITLLPLEHGLSARLKLRPRGVRVGARSINVVGGALGVIIDARGRPLMPPRDPDARRAAIQEWQASMLGGEPA